VQRNVVFYFGKNHIEKPYYLGRKYNEKAMVCLMDVKHLSKVMDEIGAYILSIPQVDRCSNKKIVVCF
jgi:hypothetical protein